MKKKNNVKKSDSSSICKFDSSSIGKDRVKQAPVHIKQAPRQTILMTKAGKEKAAGMSAGGKKAADKKATKRAAVGAAGGSAGGSARDSAVDATGGSGGKNEVRRQTYLPCHELAKYLPNSLNLLAFLMGNHQQLGRESLIRTLDDKCLHHICTLVGKSGGLECLDIFVDGLKNGKINFRQFEQLCSLCKFIHDLEMLGMVSLKRDGTFVDWYDSNNTRSVFGFASMKIIDPPRNMTAYIEELKKMFEAAASSHTWTVSAQWSTEQIRTWETDRDMLLMRAMVVMRAIGQVTNFDHATIPKHYRHKPFLGHFIRLQLKFGRHNRYEGKISDADDLICDRLLSPPFDKLENGKQLMRIYQEYCCEVAALTSNAP